MAVFFSKLPGLSGVERQVVLISEDSNLFNYNLKFCSQGFIASGSSFDEQVARKKAYSEAVERLFLKANRSDQIRKQWKFDVLPSTDCLAAGFSLPDTIKRSNFEAIERNCRILYERGELALKPISEGYIGKDLRIFAESKIGAVNSFVGYVRSYSLDNMPVEGFFVIGIHENFGQRVFGYAFASSIAAAQTQAIIEVYRNKMYLKIPTGDYELIVDKIYLQAVMEKSFSTLPPKSLALSGMNKIVLPKISWQKVARVGEAFLCRSFILGFLDLRAKSTV